MKKIKFEDLPSENTAINSANLDTLQNNIEESAVIVSSTEPQTKEKVWFQKSKNLLDNKATSQKINGITYTVNPDKTVTANGKATGMSILFLTESNATLEKGNYNITDGVGDYTNYFTQLNVINPTQGEQFINTGFKYDFSISEKSKLGVKIIIRDGVTVNNLKFKPMLVKQENKNIPYEPYLTKKILTKTNGVFEEFYNEENTKTETITNENGTAIKFADGTMICMKSDIRIPANNESIFVTLPIPFIDNAYVPMVTQNYIFRKNAILSYGGNTDKTFKVFTDKSTQITSFSYIAIGRWK